MGELVGGIFVAAAASALYSLALVLQAGAARRSAPEPGLRVSLLARLSHSRRWLAGTLLTAAAWPLQVFALTLAPLTVVQPVGASGLLLLLGLGRRHLRERVGRAEVLAVAAIVAGVGGLAAVTPPHTDHHSGPVRLVVALVILTALTISPYLARRHLRRRGALLALGAGCGFAMGDFVSKLVADELATGTLWLAAVWLGVVLVGGGLGFLAEQTALQRRGATRVAPVVFSVQVSLPVLLAGSVGGEGWASSWSSAVETLVCLAAVVAGAAVVNRSAAVARMTRSDASG